MIKDNVGFGEWDWEELANAWDSEKLEDWGLDVPDFGTDDIEEDNILNETCRGYMKVSGGFVEEEETEIDKLFKSFNLDLDAKK